MGSQNEFVSYTVCRVTFLRTNPGSVFFNQSENVLGLQKSKKISKPSNWHHYDHTFQNSEYMNRAEELILEIPSYTKYKHLCGAYCIYLNDGLCQVQNHIFWSPLCPLLCANAICRLDCADSICSFCWRWAKRRLWITTTMWKMSCLTRTTMLLSATWLLVRLVALLEVPRLSRFTRLYVLRIRCGQRPWQWRRECSQLWQRNWKYHACQAFWAF